MKTNRLDRRIFALVAALILAVTFAGCFGAVLAIPQTYSAQAFSDSEALSSVDNSSAVAAAKWGDKDTATDVWQYKNDFLNVSGMKSVIDGWDKNRLSKDNPVIIAVIDTGLDVNHELFDGVLLKNAAGKVLGYNAYAATKSKPTQDELNNITDVETKHGTSVAGVIAMLIHELGLEDYIKIYPIKANSVKNGEEVASFGIDAVVKALDWARTGIGADIINMSFSTDKATGGAANWKGSRTLNTAINLAAQNAVLLAAAGNDYSDSATRVEYPAGFNAVVGVMSYGENGRLYKENNSKGSNYGDIYDVVAPGQNIYSAAGLLSGGKSKYDSFTGTSAATPSASFTAALLKLRFAAEGQEEPGGGKLLRMFKYAEGNRLQAGGYSLKALEPYKILIQDFSNVPDYSVPTGIGITDNGDKNEETGAIEMRLDAVEEVTLVADLEPYARTDPDLDGQIEWYEVYTDNTEKYIGKGKSIGYLPQKGGNFFVEARLNGISESVEFNILYGQYVAGDVRVTYKTQALKDVKDAAASGKLYTKETTVFALTGLEYVDPSIEIKWFVNGVYAASGREFSFSPSATGKYVVSAQYGDNAATPYANSFIAEVKSFITRPLDITALTLGCAAFVAVLVTIIVIVIKRRRAALEAEASDTDSVE